MSTNPLVSIIIPIYNVENYLQRAIDSACRQTYTNIEIILVDDGSTDHSAQRCHEAMTKDARIRLIAKKNGGLSSARNAGIKQALGEYIFFLDADDSLEPETIQNMLPPLLYEHYDLVACSIKQKHVTSDNTVEHEQDLQFPREGKYTNLDFLKGIMSDDSAVAFITGSACNKLYKSSYFIHNHLFSEEIKYAEDDYFAIDCLQHCPKIYYFKNAFYNYYIYPVTQRKSLVNSSIKTRFEDYKKIYQKLDAVIFDYVSDAEKNLRKHNFIDRVILTCVLLCRSDTSFKSEELKAELHKIVNDPTVIEAIPFYKKKCGNSWTIPLLIKHKRVDQLLYFAVKRARSRYKV